MSKPESRRARRKRERQGVTPEQVWPRGGQRQHPSNLVPPPLSTKPEPIRTEPYTESIDVPGGTITVPCEITDEQANRIRDAFTARANAGPTPLPTFHNRDITDRLKAAERCVLAATEALTGETHDGIYDYDQAREHLLSVIQARACPVQQPVDPVE